MSDDRPDPMRRPTGDARLREVPTMPGMVPPVADEREALLGYLAQQRLALRVSAHGLTDETGPADPDRRWPEHRRARSGTSPRWSGAGRPWSSIATTPRRRTTRPTSCCRRTRRWPRRSTVYAEATAETHRASAGIVDLGQAVKVPTGVPWFPDDVEAWSVRWVLLHLIEETARHAGHADLVREAIDGATAFPLMAAVEGWPATPWMQPWEPVAG